MPKSTFFLNQTKEPKWRSNYIKKITDNTVRNYIAFNAREFKCLWQIWVNTKPEVVDSFVAEGFQSKIFFRWNPESMDSLEPDDIFTINPDKLGEFSIM